VRIVIGFVIAVAALLAQGPELKLWPNGAPGEAGGIGPEEVMPPRGEETVLRITGVSEPSITVYRPPQSGKPGAAVVICPGGGYNILAYDKEGTEVAGWLNSIGVTGVVLKYRVPRRKGDEFPRLPLQDAQRAIRLVRRNAAAWGLDPARIGILGFSAGGHLAVMAATHWEEPAYERVDAADDLSCRPDFMIPVYAAYLTSDAEPWTLSPKVKVTPRTPPAFMVVTYDDKNRGSDAGLLLSALKRAGVAAEAHIFLKGGHGYGLRPSANPVSQWPRLCEQWMRAMGLID
jgi:acetyl esterase/lipase